MKLQFRKLRADEIDCRVAQIEKTWCTLLLYKDARVDQNILDETVGCMNWQKRYVRDNANCIVGIWDEEKNQWVEKEDTGTESFSEAEKGLASDSFKRACFNWGIGRELYTAPSIFILPRKDIKYKNKGSEVDEFFEYKDSKYTTKTRFEVELITYDDLGNIKDLIIRDQKGNERFTQVSKELEQDLNKIVLQLRKAIERAEELDKDFEREKLYEYFGKQVDSQLTYEEKKEAIELLTKKYKKKEGK
ncbi:MAG: hypothetical protein VZQ62_00890 [Methanosphaera sp.]|nr:hypothetical protein [Methanosphaera sp.]